MKFVLLLACMVWQARASAVSPPAQRSGKYQVMLRLPPDGLYAREEMQIEMRISDTTLSDPLLGDAPVVRAGVLGTVDMPSMQGMPRIQELAHPEGVAGDYGIHPTFAHGGDYRFVLSVTPVGDAPFMVEFPLHVDDILPPGHKKTPPAYSIELLASKNPRAGEPVELELRVRQRDHPKDVVTAFDVAHERLIHLVIVRKDLTNFAHEHPELGSDGVFRLQHIFAEGGEYHFLADVAPKGAGSQILSSVLKVAGGARTHFDLGEAAASPQASVSVAEGMRFEISGPVGPFPARKTGPLTFRVTRADSGEPVTDLEPYLGAMGHLMLVSEGAAVLVHSHPDAALAENGHNGSISFLTRFPAEGYYRGWLQVQQHGKVVTASFVVTVAGP